MMSIINNLVIFMFLIAVGTFQIIATNKYGAQAKKRELTTELRKLEKLYNVIMSIMLNIFTL